MFYGKLLHGDLGLSIRTERPIKDEILRYLPATFELATFSIVLSIVFGVLLGVLSAIKRGKLIDQFSRFIALIGVSTPNFWLCTILLIVFYGKLGWVGPGKDLQPVDGAHVHHEALPGGQSPQTPAGLPSWTA